MIAAILSGPNYFSPNHDESTIEVHDNLEEVIDALLQRYDSSGMSDFTYTTLDGKEHTARFPSFDVGTRFTCYQVSVNFQSPALKAEALEEALTDVHMGLWCYTVRLDNESGIAVAVVEAAGIS